MGLFLLWVIFQVCRCKPDAQVWTWCKAILPAVLHGRLAECECLACLCVCAVLATPFLLPAIWQSTELL